MTDMTGQSEENTAFNFDGEGKTLFGVYIVNLIFTLLTFGIYYFWAKTNIRKFIYQHTEFAGDRFEYHGTGFELFIGFVKLLPILLVIFGLLPFLYFSNFSPEIAQSFYILTLYLFLFLFYPFIAINSYRYLVSRSSWRNIRFQFSGNVSEFSKIYFPGMLLTIITMGIYYPWYSCKAKTYFWQKTKLGNEPFNFDANGDGFIGIYLSTIGVLFAIYIVFIIIVVALTAIAAATGLIESPDHLSSLLVVAIAGIILFTGFIIGYIWVWAWYQARSSRFFWKHTMIQNKRFRSTLKTSSLLKISLLGLLITVVTLGLGVPWVIVMTYRLIINNISLDGAVDLESIRGLTAQDSSALGDDMSSTFDAGAGIFDI